MLFAHLPLEILTLYDGGKSPIQCLKENPKGQSITNLQNEENTGKKKEGCFWRFMCMRI